MPVGEVIASWTLLLENQVRAPRMVKHVCRSMVCPMHAVILTVVFFLAKIGWNKAKSCF